MKRTWLLVLLLYAGNALAADPRAVPINLTGTDNSAPGQSPAPIMADEDLNFSPTVDAFGEAVNLNSAPLPASVQNSAADNITVNTRQSLSENIKENAPADIQNTENPSNSTNWVGQIISTAKDTLKNSNQESNQLANMLEQSQGQNKRSNASVFDISGVMLRMSYKQAEETLNKRGYRKTVQKMDIPNFIRWRNEEKCRNQGVIGYERLENCVTKLAQKEHYQFISEATFNKFDTKETVKIFLTSTFTNNKIYKITYRSEAANLTGNSAKAMYLRNIKVYDFWKKINQKYGVPDNKDDVMWGLGGNKPYMRAATGFLVLEDNMLRELDYTRMSREDQRFMNTDLYTF